MTIHRTDNVNNCISFAVVLCMLIFFYFSYYFSTTFTNKLLPFMLSNEATDSDYADSNTDEDQETSSGSSKKSQHLEYYPNKCKKSLRQGHRLVHENKSTQLLRKSDEGTEKADQRPNYKPCPECKKWYHFNYIHEHIKQVCRREKERVPCPKCDKTFAEKSNLAKHLKKLHDPKVQNLRSLLTCKKCFLKFSDSESLSRHQCGPVAGTNLTSELLKRAGGENTKQRELCQGKKSLVCGVCKKTFANATKLADHARYHKPFTHTCPICSKQFYGSYLLARHIKGIHQKKPFKCQHCEMSFTIPQERDAHVCQNDAGDKPFGCPLCDKRFSVRGDLKYHIYFHTGEKPFKCLYPNCDKAYSRSSTLTQHNRVRHRICKHKWGSI